ncbi:putative DNA-directed RNA polymerases I and III subunit RPAC2, partial [Operophtera brumata]
VHISSRTKKLQGKSRSHVTYVREWLGLRSDEHSPYVLKQPRNPSYLVQKDDDQEKKIIIDDVEFCGYTVPHPAESKMHFRIQAQETPALEILKRGLRDLEKVCDHTIDLFEKEVKEFCNT